MKCAHCNKEIERYLNYCDWDCFVQAAKDRGGRVHCPNNLPIRCVKYNDLMLECEHGDHPDYKFPVTAISEDEEMCHALIYNDRTIALTLYECCYFMWTLGDGQLHRGPKWWGDEGARLSDKSLSKIKGNGKVKNS